MKNMAKLILPAAAFTGAALGGLAFLIAPGSMEKSQRKTFKYKNYAHRGLHKRSRVIPENSLAAFEAAASYGYGIELDVQLSKDGQVVVFHDDTLNRVCGVDARVDGLTLAELRELSLCGTDERIPLFSELLGTVNGAGALIVELKTGRRNTELCEKTLALLRGYKGEFCIESFDPRIVAWFRKNAPDIVRGQLSCPPDGYNGELPAPAAFILSRTLLNFLARPQFIAYKLAKKPLAVKLCEALGAMRVCWTSHDPTGENGNDTVIFEFYEPGLDF